MAIRKAPLPEGLRPAKWVRERYSLSDMGLWKWIRHPEMDFPAPIYIGGYRFWWLHDIEAWEASRRTELRSAA